MHITILGSGTSIPHPQRASPGLAIQIGKTVILVDPSSGSLHRAERYGIKIKNVSHVFISHFHLDHIGDIAPLLFARKNPIYFEAEKLTLIGPPGLKQFYRKLVDLHGNMVRLASSNLEIREIGTERLKFSNWAVRSLPVVHTKNSVGYRFVDSTGTVFTYSGDTDYCPALIKLSTNADAALIEAAQPSQLKIKGHLTPQLAGKIAQEAGVRRLVITHLYPVCDGYDLLEEIRDSGYEGPADIAFDGMKFRL